MSIVGKYPYQNSSPFRQRVRDMFDGRDPGDVIGMLRAEGKRWVDICEILQCNMTTINRHIRKDDLGFVVWPESSRLSVGKSSKEFQARVKRGEVPTYKRGGFAVIGRQFGYYRNHKKG